MLKRAAQTAEDADLHRGLAGGPSAHAGRGLPQRDALPPPRRPGPEGRGRHAELPAGADAGRRAAEALADVAAARLANLVSPRGPWPTGSPTWISGAGHLLARVIVNRLWQHHLGRGIVATPSDFGARGEAPTHPELLDWLATELINNGWQLKPIHKLIMTSAVYQNRQRARRGETARSTATTSCSGGARRAGSKPRSSATPAGRQRHARSAHVRPRHARRGEQAAQHLLHGQAQQADADDDGLRRPRRLGRHRRAADDDHRSAGAVADEQPACSRLGQGMARRIAADAKTPLEDAIQAGYLMALSRPPTPAELTDSTAFVKRQQETYKAEVWAMAGNWH